MQIVDQIEERYGPFILHGHQHDVVDADEITPQDAIVGVHGGRRYFLHPQDVHQCFHGHEQGFVASHDGVPNKPGGHEGITGAAGRKKTDKLPISAICPLWLPLGDLNPGPPD